MKYLSITLFLSIFLGLLGCQSNSTSNQSDIVYSVKLRELRLGDGVPLDIDVYLRWEVQNPPTFFSQFSNVDTFNRMVLYPRAKELGNMVANEFESVDSVFSSQRELFLVELKNNFEKSLGEESIQIKEVIVSNITFPESYTSAMEKVGLQRQLLEAIQQEKAVAIERSKAEKAKTEAQAKVKIAKAEADGRVAQINARTEESRRKSELAKAETQAQITRKEAQAEADRNRLLAKAELEKKTDLKDLDLLKKQQLDNLEIDKAKKVRKAELESQIELAEVVQQNPTFASFLVNKELASKVEIAVLPTGSDPNVFGNLLKQGVNGSNN